MELDSESGRRPSLSMAEQRVGSLVAADYSDAEIATRLRLSPQTVAWCVAKLCRRLEAASRAELVSLLRALSGS